MKVLMKIASAALAVLCLIAPLRADVGADMTAAAQKFLGALTDAGVAKATMEFDNPARLDWHNIPKAARKGLQYREMTAAQRELCHQLLKVSLSESGYQKAVTIMSLENNLLEGEKGRTGTPFRDPERYFLTIFGKPDTKGTWGYSFEGHHFSLNFVIRDGNVISHTPTFWGANPAIVKVFVAGGPPVGTRTLADEEQRALDLVNQLDETQRRKAIIAEQAPADYRAAGKPQPVQSAPEGIAASELTDAQKKTLWSLLEVYSSHQHPDVSRAELEEIKLAGLDNVYFAWAGGMKIGVPHYFRVQGPTFVLELVNYQSDPEGNPSNHIHSVWRSLKGDFAVPLETAAK